MVTKSKSLNLDVAADSVFYAFDQSTSLFIRKIEQDGAVSAYTIPNAEGFTAGYPPYVTSKEANGGRWIVWLTRQKVEPLNAESLLYDGQIWAVRVNPNAAVSEKKLIFQHRYVDNRINFVGAETIIGIDLRTVTATDEHLILWMYDRYTTTSPQFKALKLTASEFAVGRLASSGEPYVTKPGENLSSLSSTMLDGELILTKFTDINPADTGTYAKNVELSKLSTQGKISGKWVFQAQGNAFLTITPFIAVHRQGMIIQDGSTKIFALNSNLDLIGSYAQISSQHQVNWYTGESYLLFPNYANQRFQLTRLKSDAQPDPSFGVQGVDVWDLSAKLPYSYKFAAGRWWIASTDNLTWQAFHSDFSQATEPAKSTVVELYNTDLKHYFITQSAAEVEQIMAGSAGSGWQKTGQTFTFYADNPSGSVNVSSLCRFYGSNAYSVNSPNSRVGPNSHVYVLEGAECSAVKNDPGWIFEGLVGAVMLASNSQCAANQVPIYRSYNNGYEVSNGKWLRNDSNHRYTASKTIQAEMIAQGWRDEGVVFCAPTP